MDLLRIQGTCNKDAFYTIKEDGYPRAFQINFVGLRFYIIDLNTKITLTFCNKLVLFWSVHMV